MEDSSFHVLGNSHHAPATFKRLTSVLDSHSDLKPLKKVSSSVFPSHLLCTYTHNIYVHSRGINKQRETKICLGNSVDPESSGGIRTGTGWDTEW